MPNALLLGLMTGAMNMIPYFGAIIGGAFSILITLLSGGLYKAIFVAVYIIVMQQIDGNILQPRIVGNSIGLKPIYVLLSITIFGGLMGFWGIFLGVPIMAVIQMLIKDLIRYRARKRQAVRYRRGRPFGGGGGRSAAGPAAGERRRRRGRSLNIAGRRKRTADQ